MLTADVNRLLTQTGPGTPAGTFFRSFWLPALLASELAEPGGAPVRLKLLGERLLAFRDSEGRLGLIDEFCAHRGVSLWFGRNEEGGLRCPYHGWKYDVSGQCIDVPSEPSENGFCSKIKLTAYKLVERGGVIWAYMGPPETMPELPGFEWCALPATHRYISQRKQECNFLQAMEGGIDSSHVSWLHAGELHSDSLHRATKGAEYQSDRAPKFEVVENDGGLLIGARRNGGPGEYYWRITQWIMPFYSMVPPYGDNALNGHAWVPLDDETCMAWTFTYHPMRVLTDEELEVMRNGGGIHVRLIPGTFRPELNRDNDYRIDRAAQKAGLTMSGVHGVATQDCAVQESMGPVVDRTRENLVSTDNAIIMARHRLRRAILGLESGKLPPGRDPSCHLVRSAAFVLPATETFHTARAEAFIARAGTAHISI